MNCLKIAHTSYRNTPKPKANSLTAKYVPVMLTLILGGLLLNVNIGSITGLHGDECKTFFRAQEIANGLRPISGPMTNYTGPIYSYALWPVCVLFGMDVTAFRSASVGFNLLAVLFTMLTMKVIVTEGKWWIWAGLLLTTLPTFVLFSRYTAEVTNIGPLLFITALYALALSSRSPTDSRKIPFKSIMRAFIGGVLLGLNIYNHILSIVVPAALSAALLLCYGSVFVRDRRTYAVAVGILIGYLPALIALWINPVHWMQSVSDGSGNGLVSYLFDKDWHLVLPVIHSMLDGRLLYLRFCGENLVYVIPYLSGAFLFVLAWRVFLKRKRPLKRFEMFLLTFWILLVTLITLMVNQLSLRYYLLPCYLIPLFMVYFLSEISQAKKQLIYARTIQVLLVVVTCLNLFYISANYFYAFSKSGGKATNFVIGNFTQIQEPFIETSSHFIGTQKLYDQLVANGIDFVFAQNSIATPLQFYDFSNHRLKIVDWPTYDGLPYNPILKQRRSAILFYNFLDGESSEALNFKEILKKLFSPKNAFIRYERGMDYDPHFLVYVSRMENR